jgi:Holliday junction DNA helicase RuvA
MIFSIDGCLVGRGDGFVVIDVGGIGYQVFLPGVVEKALAGMQEGDALQLQTIYYLQIEQTRATPVLLGFQNSIQREFFEKLLTVPRMGPKGALSAFSRPLSTVASAIEAANYSLLQSLPGVGKQKARDLVATLQGKVATFAMMQDADLDKRSPTRPAHDVSHDALQLLELLGHKRAEAERMVAEALQAEPAAADAEALVRIIYKRQQEAA